MDQRSIETTAKVVEGWPNGTCIILDLQILAIDEYQIVSF